ncbi:MAG: DUF4835 domain-containing protein [Crocinitomicaceae bacterium]|nr:DUF4835 domain-containing protein [Crocinitomicaceae bacterium]|tara:strand:- start:1265 stop:2191 length:927 start_codon:yes stop_codon:yes gene_type:complete
MTNFRNGLSFATALVFAVTFSVFTSSTAHSQELNCNVQVMAPRIANVEASVFEALEDGIREFMNGRRWTNDNFNFEERIECTMQINISNAISATQFSGSIQVQSNRPVYASDYNTPMLFVIDGDFEINWVNGTAINFNTGMHRDNLSSILAYYAYMILGMDYDSFGMEAGTEYYLKAQTIVANAQNASGKGWRASEGKQNRYWLVENMLSQTFRPLRYCMYNYHRKGMDLLYSDVETARLNIGDAIVEMRSTNRIRPASYNLQVFFLAKSDEIIKIFEPAPEPERVRLLPVLKQMDPGNIAKYDGALL